MSKTYRVAFDGRGLCMLTGEECDGMLQVRYIADPARTSVHIGEGETEWHIPADLEPVAEAEEQNRLAVLVQKAEDEGNLYDPSA